MLRKLSFLILCSLFFNPGSHSFAYSSKEGNINAVLGVMVLKSNFSDALSPAPWTLGPGLLIQGDLSARSTLEIGFFHFEKYFLRKENGQSIIEKTQSLHTSFGYRHALSAFVSVSGALSTSYAMGEPEIVRSEFSPSNYLATSARDTAEYGIDISLQTEFFKTPSFNLVADIKYSYSLTPQSEEKSDHFGGFIAFKYLIQSNQNKAKAQPER
jgi:hypothetical protein